MAMFARIDAGGCAPVAAVGVSTEVTAAPMFYPAEDYHQEYFKRNPYQGYCQAVISPKVAKFRKQYSQKLKR